MTPADWLESRPWGVIPFFSENIIITKPTSSVLVYALGFVAVGIGIAFLRDKSPHTSHEWWGIALILWGLGALFAGTSYQAFSYAIKCVGREFCLWTSW